MRFCALLYDAKKWRNKLFAALLFEWLSFRAKRFPIKSHVSRCSLSWILRGPIDKCAAFFTMSFRSMVIGFCHCRCHLHSKHVWYSASSVSSLTSKAFKNSLKSLKCCYETARCHSASIICVAKKFVSLCAISVLSETTLQISNKCCWLRCCF